MVEQSLDLLMVADFAVLAIVNWVDLAMAIVAVKFYELDISVCFNQMNAQSFRKE